MEKCSQCDHLKKENTAMRKAMAETSTNYVEVVNENLALRRQIEELEKSAGKQEIVFKETVYPDPRTVDTSTTACEDKSCKRCLPDDPTTWGHPQIGAN